MSTRQGFGDFPEAQQQQGFPSPQQGYPTPGAPQSPDQVYKPVFSQEELRVLRECNLESFYYRCVPLAAVCTTASYFAMRKGYLKMSEKYGYTPKMLGAAFLGYFAGKFSYQNACAEKLMRLPDSPVGEALRKRKGRMGFQESLNMEPGFALATPTAEPEPQPQHPRQPTFGDYREDNFNEGLEDYHRGVSDSLNPYMEVTPTTPQNSTTYDELRRQNREEYAQRMAEKYRKPIPVEPTLDHNPPNLSSEDSAYPRQTLPPSPSSPPKVVRRNKYGDEIIE